jgi:hypothetical protein
MLYPGMVIRCAQCGQQAIWLVDQRTRKVASVTVAEVLGGNIELLPDDEYMVVAPHPAVERHAYHASVCE